MVYPTVALVNIPGPAIASVLLVEDEEAVRRVVQRMLEREGHVVLPAENGLEALTLAEWFAGAIDLVVTDLVLPGINGRELAERLGEGRPDLHVLYITGHPDNEILRGLVGEGASVLEKPFSRAELLEAVRCELGG